VRLDVVFYSGRSCGSSRKIKDNGDAAAINFSDLDGPLHEFRSIGVHRAAIPPTRGDVDWK